MAIEFQDRYAMPPAIGFIALITSQNMNLNPPYTYVQGGGTQTLGDLVFSAAATAKDIVITTHNPQGAIRLATTNGGPDMERVTILNNGKVGILNTNPLEALQIGNWINVHLGADNQTKHYIGWNDYTSGTGSRQRISTGTSFAINFNEVNRANNFAFYGIGCDKFDQLNNAIDYTEPNDGYKGIVIYDWGYSAGSLSDFGQIGLGTTNLLPFTRVTIQGLTNNNTTNALAVFNNDVTNLMRSSLFVIRDNGNIGINEMTPTAKLFINGGDNTSATYAFIAKNSSSNNLLSIRDDGKVQIGNHHILTTSDYYNAYLLSVDGTILCKELIVSVMSTDWADFVFKKDYKLLPLNELESKIKKDGKLPDIPSETDVQKNGVNIAEVQSKLLQKIEELTLYVIEINKENQQLKDKVGKLENNLNKKSKKR